MASQFSFEAIGTHWQIDIYQDLSGEQEGLVVSAVRERIELFEQTYSRFRKDSLVTAMATAAGMYTMPDDAEPLLSLYHELCLLTDGLVTPLIGNVLTDAGYDAYYSLQQKPEIKIAPAWDDVLDYRHPVLEIKKPTQLDFGAFGKGYLIDIVAGVLQQHGIAAFCVDAGGDMIHRNSEPLRVALEDPNDTSKAIGVVGLRNKSLCGSAGNRRKWQNFHHIINPKELTSPQEILAVWVLADTTLLADALTTCLFFVSAEKLKQYSFEYCLVRDDYSIERSNGFLLEGDTVAIAG